MNSPSVTLPIAGAEARLGWYVGRESVGLSAFLRRDLGSAKFTAEDDPTVCFFECTPTSHDYVVGGSTIGLAVDLHHDFGGH